jgi:uncharacterized membrane protein YsdA (DUF1294 family)
MLKLVGLYLLAINLVTFAVFASDKQRAIDGGRRVPEATLLQLAAVGGTTGAFAAQKILRHKTRKEPFRTLLWLIAFVQVAAIVGIGAWAHG